jgi:hypothetical protein
MSESEILLLMRENAALCNLEAEVIVALKAYQVGDQQIKVLIKRNKFRINVNFF